jgi:hypothetical protein
MFLFYKPRPVEEIDLGFLFGRDVQKTSVEASRTCLASPAMDWFLAVARRRPLARLRKGDK